MSRVLQADAEQESQMRAEIHKLSMVNMMEEFASYAVLERKINKMTDKLKTHVKARTTQLAKIKWMTSVTFYVLHYCFRAWITDIDVLSLH
uniref:Uncharacterized protein n=1 Tax=Colobus angolensis palliatus TaxID=336983 RepID=A0A2K5I3Y4_COLAP